jgi:hypothetical protein
MPASLMRVLVVGPVALDTAATLERLARHNWGSYAVDSLSEAKSVFKTLRFDVVLAAESLSDGRGYELAAAAADFSATLLVSVTLSESSLWLPVVYCGDNVLGQRALNARMLELELEFLLSQPTPDRANARGLKRGRATAAGAVKGIIPPLREPLVAIPAATRGTRAEDRMLRVPGKGEAHDSDRFDAGSKHAAAGMRHPPRHD